MKNIILFLLFSVSSFSQDYSLTKKQIDSICLKSKDFIDQKTPLKKSKKVTLKNKQIKTLTGTGSETIRIFNQIDNDARNIVETYEIIKVSYEYEIDYSFGNFEYVFVDIYYKNNTADSFYIEEKYKLGQVSKSQQLYLSQSNLEEEDLTDFNFCKSFKDWITVKSKEINTIFYNKR